MNQRTLDELNKILESTKTLSFPILSSNDKKELLLSDTRCIIDGEIQQCLDCEDKTRFANNKDHIWDKATYDSKKEFESLPVRLKMNSFYLQEVMHRYVESAILYLKEDN